MMRAGGQRPSVEPLTSGGAAAMSLADDTIDARTINGLELATPTVSPEKLAAIDEARAALLAEV
jgi:hypothetical protein